MTDKTAYYWRVRAVNYNGYAGVWSETRNLHVDWDGSISGLSPADGASTTDTTPEFSWGAVNAAAKYQIQIADSAAGLAGTTEVEVKWTSYTPGTALTNKQTHYWRVRAVDGDGQFGDWSSTYSLLVDIGTVSGMFPADGASTTDTTPELSWDAVTGAAKYEVQLADSAGGLTGTTVVVTENRYTPDTALDLKSWYWRVRAGDAVGQYGDWSNTVVVVVVKSYSIGGTGPAGGIVFYDKGSYSDGWRFLEAAASDTATVIWGGYGTVLGGTSTGIGTGKANTEAIVNKLGAGNYAAYVCYNWIFDGYDDWFLPSKDELNELYKQKDTVGVFKGGGYWSSSESDSSSAWGHGFHGGGQDRYYKDVDYSRHVRAIRAF